MQMNRRTRGQIAELIEDTILQQGFRPRTAPFVWVRQLFGWMFESKLPMDSMSMQETRAVAVWVAILFPLVLVAAILAAPIEWWRARRTSLHNRKTQASLLAPPPDLPPNAARLLINYRIERDGRPLSQSGAPPQIAHWQWPLNDPYEVIDRPSRPW
ncbi:MAG: hypothetical protein R3F14_40560 [Polyangiaceae bacterium]